MRVKTSDLTLGKGIAQRLKDVRANDSRSRVQELTGIHLNTITNYEAGRLPDIVFVLRFCEAYGVNEKWLLTGRGPKMVGDGIGDATYELKICEQEASSGRSNPFVKRPKDKTISIPWSAVQDTIIDLDRYIVVFNRGVGNMPAISDGDLLIVETKVLLNDDGFYLIDAAGSLMCRSVERRMDGGATVRMGDEVQVLDKDAVEKLDIFGRARWRIGAI